MEKRHILIVDDQRDIRRLFRSGLESLSPQYHVMDVPSGEEALLEISRGTIDLLVTDVRLAGITGLELIKKIKRRHPGLKVILITGLSDPNIRQKVAGAEVDAFFYKPVEIADLQDAVERCLGTVNASPVPLEAPPAPKKERSGNLADHLSELRQDLNAITTVLVDDRGRIMAQAGDFPSTKIESTLIPPIMATFSASEKISQSLGMKSPDDLMYFRGMDHDLFVAHVGPSLGLLLVIEANGAGKNGSQAAVMKRMRSAADSLLEVLTNLGVPLEKPEEGLLPAIQEVEEIIEDGDDHTELDDIFHQASRIHLNSSDVDAFWESLVEDAESNGAANADALTYEQARRLGLTPKSGV